MPKLAELERQLNPTVFFRISRSAMVNLTCVQKIQSEGRAGYFAVLKNGHKLHIKRGLDELKARLKFTK
jgi:DNA-binding LytR/AlgR family response regulator